MLAHATVWYFVTRTLFRLGHLDNGALRVDTRNDFSNKRRDGQRHDLWRHLVRVHVHGNGVRRH